MRQGARSAPGYPPFITFYNPSPRPSRPPIVLTIPGPAHAANCRNRRVPCAARDNLGYLN